MLDSCVCDIQNYCSLIVRTASPICDHERIIATVNVMTGYYKVIKVLLKFVTSLIERQSKMSLVLHVPAIILSSSCKSRS